MYDVLGYDVLHSAKSRRAEDFALINLLETVLEQRMRWPWPEEAALTWCTSATSSSSHCWGSLTWCSSARSPGLEMKLVALPFQSKTHRSSSLNNALFSPLWTNGQAELPSRQAVSTMGTSEWTSICTVVAHASGSAEEMHPLQLTSEIIVAQPERARSCRWSRTCGSCRLSRTTSLPRGSLVRRKLVARDAKERMQWRKVLGHAY